MQSTIVAQHSCFGDGGLLSALLASRLVLDTMDVAMTHAARLAFISAYQEVLDWVSELGEKADTVGGKHHDLRRSETYSDPETSHSDHTEHCPCCCTILSLRDAGAQAYVAVVRNVVASKQVGIPPGSGPMSHSDQINSSRNNILFIRRDGSWMVID